MTAKALTPLRSSIRNTGQLIYLPGTLPKRASVFHLQTSCSPTGTWLVGFSLSVPEWVCHSPCCERSMSAFISGERTVQQTGTRCVPNVVWNQPGDHMTEKRRTSVHLCFRKQHRENVCPMEKNILGDSASASAEELWNWQGPSSAEPCLRLALSAYICNTSYRTTSSKCYRVRFLKLIHINVNILHIIMHILHYNYSLGYFLFRE